MEKLFDKIGDHFNNPEMADRVLVVKVRTDGWEQLEAALRVRNSSAKSQTESTDSENFDGEDDAKICEENSDKDPKHSKEAKADNRSESCASVDSGIAIEETKCVSKRKKTVSENVSAASCSTAVIHPAACTREESGCGENLALDLSGDPSSAAVETISESVTNGVSKEVSSDCATCIAADDAESTAEEPEVQDIGGDVESCLQSTVVREHELYVHSFWLALNSSYFRSLLFSSGMKETKCKKVEMNVSESLSAMFLMLIESLYKPDVVIQENVENLLVLMRLSHLYDANSTLKTCQGLLGSAHLTVEMCDRSLNMQAHEMLPEMEEFIKRCEEFLVAEFSPLDDHWTREDFLALSSNALKKVLGSSDLCVSSENTVFLALMRWAEVSEVFEDQLKPLLELVHMKTMTINYLHDVVTSDHPIASTVPGFREMFEEAVFYHAFSTERQCEDGEPQTRKLSKDPIVYRWNVDFGEDLEMERKKKTVKSPHFWVSGYEMFLELKLRMCGFQGLYLTICTQEFRHRAKGFVKLEYSLTSNCQKATHVIKEADVFDREGSGWGYEEFFPLTWPQFRNEFKAHLDTTPLMITAEVRLLE